MTDKQEQLSQNLDRVNMWIGNCDQKASFLLALLGVVVTVICTSDVFTKIKEIIIIPFVTYLTDKSGSFCFSRLLIAILFFGGLICLLVSIFFLLRCLMAKTNPEDYRKPGMVEKSRLFYGSIANMTYEEFCRDENNYDSDLQSQIYTNSVICSQKFENYKKALRSTFRALPLLVAAFILLLFV